MGGNEFQTVSIRNPPTFRCRLVPSVLWQQAAEHRVVHVQRLLHHPGIQLLPQQCGVLGAGGKGTPAPGRANGGGRWCNEKHSPTRSTQAVPGPTLPIPMPEIGLVNTPE